MYLTNPLLLYINYCHYCKGAPNVPYKSSVVVHQLLSLLQRCSKCTLQVLCCCTSTTVTVAKVLQMYLTSPQLLYINYCHYCKGAPNVPYKSSVVVHQLLSLLQRCFRCTLQVLCCCTSTTVTIAKVLQMYLTSPLLLYINYCHCCKGASDVPYKSSVVVHQPASVAQLDAPSDWRPGGRGFNPRRGRQHSFVEIDHEIFSTVILSLPLIQEGQMSVSGERICTILVNRLED